MSYQSDNMAFNNAMDSLSHHGVLGMKWGVRNPDTLRKYGEIKRSNTYLSDRQMRKMADESYSIEDAKELASFRNRNVEEYKKLAETRRTTAIETKKAEEAAAYKKAKLQQKYANVESRALKKKSGAYKKLRNDQNDLRALSKLDKATKLERKAIKNQKKIAKLDRKIVQANKKQYKIDKKAYTVAMQIAISDNVAKDRGKAFLKEYSSYKLKDDPISFKYDVIDREYK